MSFCLASQQTNDTSAARRLDMRRRLWPDREAQRGGGRSETIVEGDERPLPGTFPAPDERRGELSGVSGSKNMSVGQSFGKRSNQFARLNLVPSGAKLPEQSDGLHAFVSCEPALANESGERTPRFDRRSPPDDDPLEFAVQSSPLRGGGLRAAQRNNRACIPECHASIFVTVSAYCRNHRLQRDIRPARLPE
jgi:hypothetical protein